MAKLPHDNIFHPKLFSTIKEYSWALFKQDLLAGIIVGVVALPLAIAFAIASGVTPERGLATAIVGGLLISMFGGSRVQIGGPTGAFVVIVFGIVQQYGVEGCLLACLMAGVLLVVFGLLRLGVVMHFIPYPLIVGFTSGIAMIIFSSQIKDALGLDIGTLPVDFLSKWHIYFLHLKTIDPATAFVSAMSLGVLLVWPRVTTRIPGPFVVIVLATFFATIFHVPVETIGTKFGVLPKTLSISMGFDISFSKIKVLMPSAITIALLGAIESLLSATVADGMIEGKHRSNTELIAQGIANIVVPFFGGIPATGAIARTATNVKNGGRTPVAGIVHALTLVFFIYLFGQWITLVPLCVLSAILIVVSYNMSELYAFRALLRAPKMDVAVLLTTFVLTLLVDLTVAVQVGFMLSVLLFMKRMVDVSSVREITGQMTSARTEEELRADSNSVTSKKVPKGVTVYEAEGAFFFGVTQVFRSILDLGRNPPKVLVLRMRHVLALDASGLKALDDLLIKCRTRGVGLVLSGVQAQPLVAMEKSGLLQRLGKEYALGSLDEALECAQKIVANGYWQP